VTGLKKSFGSITAVDDLSFEIHSGEIVSLLGPNGAGKSTTFLCLCGLLRPDAGRLVWSGKELGPDRGRTIALIPETPEVYALLTVWEHMVFVAKSCKLAEGWESRASELLERFSLAEHRDMLGSALSKGMRQRLLVSATLLADAPVLLFDEPMIGLDPAGQRHLRETLRELRSTGKIVMVSTHMLDNAQVLSDRAIILKGGKCIFTGTFEELNAQTGGEDLESTFLRITA
jgi:ABC-type multidrug transport system ATPase subunit